MSMLLPWIRCFTENTINSGMSKCNIFFQLITYLVVPKHVAIHFGISVIFLNLLAQIAFDEAPLRRRQMSEHLKPRRPGEAEYPKNS